MAMSPQERGRLGGAALKRKLENDPEFAQRHRAAASRSRSGKTSNNSAGSTADIIAKYGRDYYHQLGTQGIAGKIQKAEERARRGLPIIVSEGQTW